MTSNKTIRVNLHQVLDFFKDQGVKKFSVSTLKPFVSISWKDKGIKNEEKLNRIDICVQESYLYAKTPLAKKLVTYLNLTTVKRLIKFFRKSLRLRQQRLRRIAARLV